MKTYRSDFGRTETTFRPNGAFIRRTKAARKNLAHATRNGVYDPITFYHLVDGLLQIEAWQPFRANELVEMLHARHPNIVWDSVTVGRILSDLNESLREVGKPALRPNRRWNGMAWEVSDHDDHRQALVDLMEDLYDLSNAQLDRERVGDFPKRLQSPLVRCPSLQTR